MAEVIEIPKKKTERGQGTIRQRGKRWLIADYDGQGRRRWESHSTEAKAGKALRLKVALKEAGKLDAADTKTTIDILANLYLADRKGTSPKSIDWLQSVWDIHLKAFFSGFQASRITTERLVEHRNERLEAGALPTTINKELMICRSMFLHALNGYTPPKVTRVPKFPARLKEPPARSGFITDEEYDKLQANCSHHWLKALLCVAYTYGWRRAELVGRVQRDQLPMLVKQIDLKNRSIELNPGATKNEGARTIRMTDEVYDFVRVCADGKKPDDAVFTWEDGSPVKDFRGSRAAMTKAAGVPIRLHDFRRSATRNLMRAGVSRDVAKRITGHKTDSMFSRYNITNEADLTEAAEKLTARRNQRRTAEASGGQSAATSENGYRTVASSKYNY